MPDDTRQRGRRPGGWFAAAILAAVLPTGTTVAAEKGWTYVVDKLVADGVPRERVQAVFEDPRVEGFTGLSFSLQPRESAGLYRGFLTPVGVQGARRCHAEHSEAFTAAERAFGVSSSVVASIIYVESACGRNTGSWAILPRLARLAMANEPGNVEENLARQLELNQRRAPGEIERMTRWRAQWLENTFYPEVRATFVLADQLGVEPLDIRGSGSGAVGVPQFLPSHYLRYGHDGNGDGRVSLHDIEDAIPSCASYLRAYGWRPGLSVKERRNVIWEYNHSPAYIDAVLSLAGRITGEPARQAVSRRRVSRHRPAQRNQARRRAAAAPAG